MKKQIASLGAGCYKPRTHEQHSVDRFTDSDEGFVHVAYKQYLNEASLETSNFSHSGEDA
jgi:hypothetical protein